MEPHLHPDHAFFINKKPINTNIPIYAPEPSRNVGSINTISDTVHLDSYYITPIPTHHSKLVKSVAYLIKKGKQRLLYTWDIIWINKEYHHLFTGLNLVITEGSYIRKGGLVRTDKETGQIYGHTGVPDLINVFKPFTQHILFVHFGNWFYRGTEAAREKLNKLGNSSGVKLHIGYDGLELDLDRL